MENKILLGDCLEVLKTLPDASIDAIVTDPPYGLGTKEPAVEEIIAYLSGDFDLDLGGDFMGKDWHIPSVAVWKECYRVLKPGGHLLSFGGTRSFDLISVGIRAAGFESRDTVASEFGVTTLQWVYGCLDEESEILTKDGWKRGVDVVEGEQVAVWEPSTEEITLGPVLEVIKAPYEGPMVQFKNDNTDQLLTPNHRVYKRHALRKMTNKIRRSWYEENWEVAEAGEINRWQRFKLPLAGYHDGEGIGGEEYAAFLGWIWTEGGFDIEGTGVRIYQSSVNQDNVEEIYRLIEKFAPNFRHGRTYVEHSWFFSGAPALSVRGLLPDKHPTFDLLWSMTFEEKRAFIDAAMRGDGNIEQKQFYQKDNSDREWFQTLVHTVGWQARDNENKKCVALHENPTTEMISRCLHKWASIQYKGIVWCVRVETGAFIARRNGRIFITGNSGFPKSLNISKAIDKLAGYIRKSDYVPNYQNTTHGEGWGGGRTTKEDPPSTEEAQKWEGYGTALKPSWEPILVFRKPIEEKSVAENVLKHGTGGLNIDATRIGGFSDDSRGLKRTQKTQDNGQSMEGSGIWKGGVSGSSGGRWPANIIFTHTEDCKITGYKKVKAPVINRWTDGAKPFGDGAGHPFESEQTGDENGMEEIPVYECADGCPVKMLDEQSGELKSGDPTNSVRNEGGNLLAGKGKGVPLSGYGDKGGASRFFTQIETGIPVYECVDGCPVKMLDEQSGVSRSEGGSRGAGGQHGRYSPISDQKDVKPGYGDEGGASRFFGQIEPDAPFLYCAKASKSERNKGLRLFKCDSSKYVALREDLTEEDMEELFSVWPQDCTEPNIPIEKSRIPEGNLKFFEPIKLEANTHPTLKPLKLMEWLVKLVAPVGSVVLDPFCGSGTTCVAALNCDCHYIGVEKDPTFHDIAVRRIKGLATDIENKAAERRQRELFEDMLDMPQEGEE